MSNNQLIPTGTRSPQVNRAARRAAKRYCNEARYNGERVDRKKQDIENIERKRIS